MRKWILALFFANLIAISAFADIFVEPSLGYGFGTNETTGTLLGFPATAKDDVTGFGLGLKAGYSATMFFGGLDLQYVLGSSKDEAGGADNDVTQTNIGAVVGLDFIFLRAWAGYIFSANVKVDDSSSTELSEGSGFKIGVGYKIIPMLSLNAEYTMITFDKMAPVPAGMTISEVQNNVLTISVSVPLSL